MIPDLEQGQETKDVTGLLNLSKNYLGQKKVILKIFKFWRTFFKLTNTFFGQTYLFIKYKIVIYLTTSFFLLLNQDKKGPRSFQHDNNCTLLKPSCLFFNKQIKSNWYDPAVVAEWYYSLVQIQVAYMFDLMMVWINLGRLGVSNWINSINSIIINNIEHTFFWKKFPI